jgi:hypothetical protein
MNLNQSRISRDVDTVHHLGRKDAFGVKVVGSGKKACPSQPSQGGASLSKSRVAS